MLRPNILAAIVLGAVSNVGAQVGSYEATSFPEDAGWTRRVVEYQSARWLDNGQFVQYTEETQPSGGNPPEDEQDLYEYSLAPWTGANAWYAQWRIITDGPRSGIPNVSPAAFVASGDSGILYHVTIADDQIRLIRDASLPLVWADITPSLPHTYRLELYGAASYFFYIDGQLIDTGVPEGAYPTSDSRLVFGARAPGQTAITRWDYIRFGVIPQPHSGDFDSNGVVDQTDLYFFIDCLLGPDYDAAGPGCRWADMNSDGKADAADIQLFISAMMPN